MMLLRQHRTAGYILALLLGWSALLLWGAWLTGQQDKLWGLMLGIGAGYVYFGLIVLRVVKSATLSLGQAVWSMRIGWWIRLTFLLAILCLSMMIPGIDFIAAVVGLFSLHIILLVIACWFAMKQKLG